MNLSDPWGLDYIDINITGTPVGTVVGSIIGGIIGGGSPVGAGSGAVAGSIGVTTGIMVDTNTGEAYVYVGPAVIPSGGPTVGTSLTVSPSNPSAGWNVAATWVSGGALQGGYTFGESGGFFAEGGIGTPRGFSASVFRSFGPFKLPQFLVDYLMSLYEEQKEDKCK